MKNHTSLPWVWEQGQPHITRYWNGQDHIVCTVNSKTLAWHENYGKACEEAGANAEFIVKAINSHAALAAEVARLKEANERLERERDGLRELCGKADFLFAHAIGHMGSSDPENKERNFQEAKAIIDEFRPRRATATGEGGEVMSHPPIPPNCNAFSVAPYGTVWFKVQPFHGQGTFMVDVGELEPQMIPIIAAVAAQAWRDEFQRLIKEGRLLRIELAGKIEALRNSDAWIAWRDRMQEPPHD